MSVTIHQGDALAVLRTLPEASVHCVVTSPPYWGLRDYGIPPSIWGGNPECSHDFELQQVGTEIGKGNWTQAINGRGEEQGDVAEFREPIRSVSERGFCKLCGAWLGCFGLEPYPELYVEHAVDIFGEVFRVLREDGTLWLNIGDSYGGCRGNTSEKPGIDNKAAGRDNGIPVGIRKDVSGVKPKDLVGIPWMLAFALRADGWYLRSDIIWAKPNPMPESVTDRPTKAHEYLFLLAKSERYYFDADAVREPHQEHSLARARRNRGGGKFNGQSHKEQSPLAKGAGYGGEDTNRVCSPGGRNVRSVWTICTQAYPEAHFATFPEKLIEPCILAGCPKGGTVLDPFTGSGTTGLVARRLGCSFLGIELNPDYIAMAHKRLSQEVLDLQEQPA